MPTLEGASGLACAPTIDVPTTRIKVLVTRCKPEGPSLRNNAYMEDELQDQGVDRSTREFDAAQEIHKELCMEVDYALTRAIGDYKLKIHSLKSRVKSSSSFRQKLLLKTYANPMSEMHDIVGVRIVCLFRDDVNKVDEIIRKTFDVVKHDDKEHTSLPEMWKYISVHYDCKFGPEYHGARYDRIKDLISRFKFGQFFKTLGRQ